MHAYTVLGAVELSNGAKLIKMRNPWGHELDPYDGGYSGAWNDNYEGWTSELRTEAGATEENDGTFFMDYEDYHYAMSETWIAPSTLNWK